MDKEERTNSRYLFVRDQHKRRRHYVKDKEWLREMWGLRRIVVPERHELATRWSAENLPTRLKKKETGQSAVPTNNHTKVVNEKP